MKNFKSALWLLLIAFGSFAQTAKTKTVTKTVIKTPARDTAATRQWVREYLKSVLTPPPPVNAAQPNCGCSSADFPVTVTVRENARLAVAFNGCSVSFLKWKLFAPRGNIVAENEFMPTSGLFGIDLPQTAPFESGQYRFEITSPKCSGKGSAVFVLNHDFLGSEIELGSNTEQPNCGCGSADFPVKITHKGNGSYQAAFNGCAVSLLQWKVYNQQGTLVAQNEFVPVSGLFDINLNGQPKGDYTLKITSSKCKGQGSAAFSIAASQVTPILPEVIIPSGDRTGTINLQPLKDPLLPTSEQTGNYELRYLESRPDFHLDLRMEEKNGQLYLTDTGHSLQSVSYTLNGWTDLENCGKLENEPILPYRLYHVSKYSIARPALNEVWMAIYSTPKADFMRSELFFYVVPKGETWNPAGESPNPIGRPAAFAKVPDFKLKNRIYGFEYEFLDETKERLDGLDLTFNRKTGSKHLTLYANVLIEFIQRKGYTNPQKPFHEFSESDCLEFANSLPIELIVAFDIEPGDWEWIIDYGHPNFNPNMRIVLNRLRERGAMAYNWLEGAASPNEMSLDGYVLGPHLNYGQGNAFSAKYKDAYSRLGEVSKRDNPFSVISTGYGYVSYDNNLFPGDGKGQNSSPQLTYLKSLDASELWRRAWPDKEQVYFSWPFQEYDFVSFPPNHVVEIPAHQARARRTDNKPLYPPTQWEDNMTLGLLTAKYLYYWCPGPVGWNPANTSSYNNAYTTGFSVWTFEQGKAPETGKFYIGKEAMAINATVKAAYRYSLIQDAMDGRRWAPKFAYKRAVKDGSTLAAITVDAITDGSWYIDALVKRQPFAIVCENNGKRVLLVQDVWARPGRFTEFEVEIGGKVYAGRTEGNRLFIAPL